MIMDEACKVEYIDHIGIAVKDIDIAMGFFKEVFGVELGEVSDISDQGVRATLIAIGQTRLELLQPLHSDTTVGRFIEKRGEGLHHLAFNVANVDESLSTLDSKGINLLDKSPREGLSGLIAFIHPKSTYGVLTEIVQSI